MISQILANKFDETQIKTTSSLFCSFLKERERERDVKVYGLGACTAFMTVVTITAWYQDALNCTVQTCVTLEVCAEYLLVERW